MSSSEDVNPPGTGTLHNLMDRQNNENQTPGGSNQPSTDDTSELLQAQETIMHNAKRDFFRILGEDINNTKLQQTLASLPAGNFRHTWLNHTIKEARALYEEYTNATRNLLDLIDDPVLLETRIQQCDTARETLLTKVVHAEDILHKWTTAATTNAQQTALNSAASTAAAAAAAATAAANPVQPGQAPQDRHWEAKPPTLNLPYFNGNNMGFQFQNWYPMIKTAILDKTHYSDETKLLYLLNYLTGPARQAVAHYDISAESLPKVIKELENRYNTPRMVINGVLNKLTRPFRLRPDNAIALRKYLDEIKGYIHTVKKYDPQMEESPYLLLNTIKTHLPDEVLDAYEEKYAEKTIDANNQQQPLDKNKEIEFLINFLTVYVTRKEAVLARDKEKPNTNWNLIKDHNRPQENYNPRPSTSTQNRPNRPSGHHNSKNLDKNGVPKPHILPTSATFATKTAFTPPCFFCKGPHKSAFCRQALRDPVTSYAKITSTDTCPICYRHSRRTPCKQKTKCTKCGSPYHNAVTCIPPNLRKTGQEPPNQRNTAPHTHKDSRKN